VFDAVMTGDQVRRGKPHPEPYRRAMRMLGIRPRHAVVIENAPNGIRSARLAGAGLIVALASSLPRRFLSGASVIVGSPAALDAALRRLAPAPGSPAVFDKPHSAPIQYAHRWR
jgi:beta-phosphoglucomutase-like phosphatase (HAD superfamily)